MTKRAPPGHVKATILRVLTESPLPMTPREIAQAGGVKPGSVGVAAVRMAEDGELVARHGAYSIPGPAPAVGVAPEAPPAYAQARAAGPVLCYVVDDDGRRVGAVRPFPEYVALGEPPSVNFRQMMNPYSLAQASE